MDRALTEGARPGHAKALSDKQEAHIIAMVCSEPPDGHARWTIRLVTEQAIRRGIVEQQASQGLASVAFAAWMLAVGRSDAGA